MKEDFEIHPNKEEATMACIEFNNSIMELMDKFNVYMTGDSFEYSAARYYDESGKVKEYVLY